MNEKQCKSILYVTVIALITLTIHSHYAETCTVIEYEEEILDTGITVKWKVESCSEDTTHPHPVNPLPPDPLEWETETERNRRVLTQIDSYIKNHINIKLSASDNLPTTKRYRDALTNELGSKISVQNNLICNGVKTLGCSYSDGTIKVDVQAIANESPSDIVRNNTLTEVIIHERLHQVERFKIKKGDSKNIINAKERMLVTALDEIFDELWENEGTQPGLEAWVFWVFLSLP